MENIIVGQSISGAVPASTTVTDVSVPSGAWQALTQEIQQLWNSYREALAAAERSKHEKYDLLLEIGKRLSEAKERLARPGRNGGWSSFARSAGLTRAEADGLVRRYRRTLVPQAVCAAGAEGAMATLIGEPASTAPEVQPVAPEQTAVSTPETCPPPQPPQGGNANPAEAPAAGPAPQPSGETVAATEEPAAEAAATPTEAGLAAAPADTGNGNVV